MSLIEPGYRHRGIDEANSVYIQRNVEGFWSKYFPIEILIQFED